MASLCRTIKRSMWWGQGRNMLDWPVTPSIEYKPKKTWLGKLIQRIKRWFQ